MKGFLETHNIKWLPFPNNYLTAFISHYKDIAETASKDIYEAYC